MTWCANPSMFVKYWPGSEQSGAATSASATVPWLALFRREPQLKGVSLPLPRRQRRILEYLVNNRGRRVSKAQIFNSIYGIFNEDVKENVESHVSKLRKKNCAVSSVTTQCRSMYSPIATAHCFTPETSANASTLASRHRAKKSAADFDLRLPGAARIKIL
jgi:hypothetical protein